MFRTLNDKYTVVDLFSGCGGFSQGFMKAGFEVITANEFWEPAALSYKHNHQDVILVQGDIRDPTVKERLYDSIKTKINVIIGGPPCQGYSMAGNRNPNDPRGQLYLDFFEIIDHLKPDFFVMENVKGLKNMKHVDPNLSLQELKVFNNHCRLLKRFKDLKRYAAQRELDVGEQEEYDSLKKEKSAIQKQIKSRMVPLIDKIMAKINEMGYHAKWKVLNAANYGVPQTRQRIIFIGTKHEECKIQFPEKTHCEEGATNGKKAWLTSREALKKYESWKEDEETSHLFTKHSPKFIKKIKNTPIGENIYKNYSDAWWRLIPDRPARTVKENHGGVFVHYKYHRACTPRELAALQSFDDHFHFKGTKSAVLKQIGNAVPTLLAKHLGIQIKKLLNGLKSKPNN